MDFRRFEVFVRENSESSLFKKEWLENTLQERLNIWLQQNTSGSPPSLMLVDLILYQMCYEELKARYAKSIASVPVSDIT